MGCPSVEVNLLRVMRQGHEAVTRYIKECADLGFDMVEVSTGFTVEDTVKIIKEVKKVCSEGLYHSIPSPFMVSDQWAHPSKQAGLKAKAEVGIQFGAGGASGVVDLEAEGVSDPQWAIIRVRTPRCSPQCVPWE